MARNADSLNSYAESFKAEGIEIYTKTADTADDAAMSKALRDAVAECGTPDVFAYNVGVTAPDSALADGVIPFPLSRQGRAEGSREHQYQNQ